MMIEISQNGGGERAGSGPQPVAVPAPHDGVGSALRAAFLPRASDLPRELSALLERLR